MEQCSTDCSVRSVAEMAEQTPAQTKERLCTVRYRTEQYRRRMNEEFKNFLTERGITEQKYLSGTLHEQTQIIELFEKRGKLLDLKSHSPTLALSFPRSLRKKFRLFLLVSFVLP
jgi:hypothetical protein